jgi:hypothetical protein
MTLIVGCHLVEPAIVTQAQAAFPDAPASQAVVLRWHLRGLNLDLALRKAALSAQLEARKTARDDPAQLMSPHP